MRRCRGGHAAIAPALPTAAIGPMRGLWVSGASRGLSGLSLSRSRSWREGLSERPDEQSFADLNSDTWRAKRKGEVG